MINDDLFGPIIRLGSGALLKRDFIGDKAAALINEITVITLQAPFRQMVTPGGFMMSVAMTNCGCLGWIADKKGYRYTKLDPLSHKKWPLMPLVFQEIAYDAAKLAGFHQFEPNVCLINRYAIGSKLSLHQDKDENNPEAPIVSLSLGLTAVFLWGGEHRVDQVVKIPLTHGDALIWGGVDRFRFHGIMPLAKGYHPLTQQFRINLTFRQVNY